MNLGDLHKVWEIKALKKPGEDEAKNILEKIAKQVQPIMRKRKWRVKLLSEFCPNNPSLLGLNVGGGIHVKLRLRRHNRDWDFFPFDQILDTMLHELCHNVHGPHNADFYRLWDELRKECEELLSKGIMGTGQGFDLPGRRLGGFSCKPPLSSLRTTALTAAEKRARLGSLLPSGPKRLGGDNTIRAALSPIQAAAMAAERRLQDDIWCGSTSCDASNDCEDNSDKSQDPVSTKQSAESSRIHCSSGEHASMKAPVSRKRSHESNNNSLGQCSNSVPGPNFVDLSINDPKFESTSSFDGKTDSAALSGALSSGSSGSMSTHDAKNKTDEAAMWECKVCTLLNPSVALICEVCSTQKPRDIATKYKFWSCKFCTLENSVKLDKCSACDRWRYSHGPPMGTRPLNLGT